MNGKVLIPSIRSISHNPDTNGPNVRELRVLIPSIRSISHNWWDEHVDLSIDMLPVLIPSIRSISHNSPINAGSTSGCVKRLS